MVKGKINVGDKVQLNGYGIVYEVTGKKRTGGMTWYAVTATNTHYVIKEQINKKIS